MPALARAVGDRHAVVALGDHLVELALNDGLIEDRAADHARVGAAQPMFVDVSRHSSCGICPRS